MLSAPDSWWCLRHGYSPPHTTLHHPQWEGRKARGRLRGPQDPLTLPRVTVLGCVHLAPACNPWTSQHCGKKHTGSPRGKLSTPTLTQDPRGPTGGPRTQAHTVLPATGPSYDRAPAPRVLHCPAPPSLSGFLSPPGATVRPALRHWGPLREGSCPQGRGRTERDCTSLTGLGI